MKVGDLVKFTPSGLTSEAWDNWYGIVIAEIPGTDERKIVMWTRDNNCRTTNKKKDLKVINSA
tara:strand:+ start:1590 stop:1778 length:189 start_codon:yes stop_codon:yes gene_type:complete